jgi:hypothetical protein
MDENIVTYVFRAIELLLLALGSMIWWHVRNSDRLLEKVADVIGTIREQQVKVDTLVGVIQRELGDLRTQADRVNERLADLESRVTGIGGRSNGRYGH